MPEVIVSPSPSGSRGTVRYRHDVRKAPRADVARSILDSTKLSITNGHDPFTADMPLFFIIIRLRLSDLHRNIIASRV